MNSQASRIFKPGDIVMKQGEKGGCAYIIEEGRVEIFMEIGGRGDQVHHVGTRGPGAIIGEMAILDDAPRMATIRALEECRLLEITREDFLRRLENADPVLRTATQVILTRYRDLLARADIRQETGERLPAEDMEKNYTTGPGPLEEIKIASDFETALQNDGEDELALHYQPVVSLKTGRIIGMEALMRWTHPQKGPVSPDIFIPVIEQTGLIVRASQWALKKAMADLKRLHTCPGGSENLFVSINFSSQDFAADGFVEALYDALSRTDIPARCVHLEITERLLIGQPANARETLEQCRKAGMSISIDDFGTGYSSLSYLHRFPIDALKIDRSFVRDMRAEPGTMELVRAIVTLGRNLGMSVIAEGVEKRADAAVLKDMGCDMAQGYYFAKPLPVSGMMELLLRGEAVAI